VAVGLVDGDGVAVGGRGVAVGNDSATAEVWAGVANGVSGGPPVQAEASQPIRARHRKNHCQSDLG